jgi:protein-S-isoprenylcysteine O-methyltransferase Ste14
LSLRQISFKSYNNIYKTLALSYTMKKEEIGDNSFGTASVVIGIMSIFSPSIFGVILGIVSLVFAKKQIKKGKNKWSKAGKILGIIGIVLGIIWLLIFITSLLNNPEIFSQIGNLQPNA